MFCPECGKKNVKGAKFCEDCGAKLVENTKVKKENSPKKPMDKKTKTIVIAVCAILLVFGIIFGYGSNKYSPESVAKDYFEAVMNGDTNKLYNYLGTQNSGFTSKKVFKNVTDLKKQEFLNYSVVSSKKSSDGLTYKVDISYTLVGENSASSQTINLVKDKKKKWLIFDNWKVASLNKLVISDFKISSPKDSNVTLAGISLDKKYIDKENGSKTYDVYVIPKILAGKYKAVVTLKNGLPLQGDVRVGGYSTQTLTSLNLSKEDESKLGKDLSKLIDKLYQSAIENKSFNDIKSDFEYKGSDLKDFEEDYNSFVKDIESSGLKKFKVTKLEISRTSLTDGKINVTANVNYEYSATRSLFGVERSKDNKSSDIMYFTFDYSDGEFKLVDASSMAKYFSVY